MSLSSLKVDDFFKRACNAPSGTTTFLMCAGYAAYTGYTLTLLKVVPAITILALVYLAIFLVKLYVLPTLFGIAFKNNTSVTIDGFFGFMAALLAFNMGFLIPGLFFALAGAVFWGAAVVVPSRH